MFSIRLAKSADISRLARIRVDTWCVAYHVRVPEAALNSRTIKGRAAYWRARLDQPFGSVFVIEFDELIGFCDLVPSCDRDADPKSIAEIAAMYVIPEHWRVGAGRALCSHAMAEARKRGYRAVTLWALASNHDALRFYEALGFTRDGSVKISTAPDGGNVHEIRYQTKL